MDHPTHANFWSCTGKTPQQQGGLWIDSERKKGLKSILGGVLVRVNLPCIGYLAPDGEGRVRRRAQGGGADLYEQEVYAGEGCDRARAELRPVGARMRRRLSWLFPFPPRNRAARRHTRLRARRCAGAPPDGWRHFALSDLLHSTQPPTPVLPRIIRPAAPVRSKYPADEVAEPRNAQEIRSLLVASATRVACSQTLRASSKAPVAHPPSPGACPRTCSAFLQTVDKEIGNAGVGYAVFKRLGFKSDQTMKEDVYWFRV